MTEKTTNTRRTRKAPIKKVDEVKSEVVTNEVVVEEVAPKVEVTSKPTRKSVTQIDVNELIPVRSLTNNTLVYVSKQTKQEWVWQNYGDVLYISYGELLNMKSHSPAFIYDCLLALDDEEVMDVFNLTSLYENLLSDKELDALFSKSAQELIEFIPKLPKGVKSSVITRARELYVNGNIDNFSVVKALEQTLAIELAIIGE